MHLHALILLVQFAIADYWISFQTGACGCRHRSRKEPNSIPVFLFSNRRASTGITNVWIILKIRMSAILVWHQVMLPKEGKGVRYVELTGWFRFEPVALETASTCGIAESELLLEKGWRISRVTGGRRVTYWLEQSMRLPVHKNYALSILAAVRDGQDVDWASLGITHVKSAQLVCVLCQWHYSGSDEECIFLRNIMFMEINC